MKKFAVVALSSLLLVNCASLTNEDVGTVSGGVIGGLIGSQFGGGPAAKMAAAAGGALFGAYLGGRIGKTMDKVDRMEMQRALETAPTGRAVNWSNPDSGYRYSVQPTRTYYRERLPCREYLTTAFIDGRRETIRGSACRQPDGSWRVVN